VAPAIGHYAVGNEFHGPELLVKIRDECRVSK
jgi:hypothetical protein